MNIGTDFSKIWNVLDTYTEQEEVIKSEQFSGLQEELSKNLVGRSLKTIRKKPVGMRVRVNIVGNDFDLEFDNEQIALPPDVSDLFFRKKKIL
jgi:hypothetical protein